MFCTCTYTHRCTAHTDCWDWIVKDLMGFKLTYVSGIISITLSAAECESDGSWMLSSSWEERVWDRMCVCGGSEQEQVRSRQFKRKHSDQMVTFCLSSPTNTTTTTTCLQPERVIVLALKPPWSHARSILSVRIIVKVCHALSLTER